MANVQFEQQKIDIGFERAERHGGLIGLLMRWGIAKDEKQANVILIAATLVFFALTIWILLSQNSSSTLPPLGPENQFRSPV
jgi:hypothetical protein